VHISVCPHVYIIYTIMRTYICMESCVHGSCIIRSMYTWTCIIRSMYTWTCMFMDLMIHRSNDATCMLWNHVYVDHASLDLCTHDIHTHVFLCTEWYIRSMYTWCTYTIMRTYMMYIDENHVYIDLMMHV